LYKHENAQRLGGFAALREAGFANLANDVDHQHDVFEVALGSAFHTLVGDSVHTGSQALLMPALLAGEPTSHGWLLAVPSRHQVMWHVIRDIGVLAVVNAMLHVASRGFAGLPGPVSPHLYWWDGSRYVQLSRLGDDGELSVVVTDAFGRVVEELGLAGVRG
jgi:hypothetical protein